MYALADKSFEKPEISKRQSKLTDVFGLGHYFVSYAKWLKAGFP